MLSLIEAMLDCINPIIFGAIQIQDFMYKCVWITGASSGIGQEAARQLANNSHVLVISARSEDKLQLLKEELSDHEKVIVAPLDLGKSESIKKSVDAILMEGYVPDLVFHAGGISQRSYLVDTSMDVDRRIMDVNYFGTIELTKLLLPKMIESGGGQFAVVSSLVGLFGYGVRSAYSASKHALHGFFESLDIELHDKNLSSTLICPGGVQTNISINALQGDGSKTGTMDEMQSAGMRVDEAVSQMIRAIGKRQKLLVLGSFKEKLGVFLYRNFPRFFFKIAVKQNPRGSVKL